MSASKKKSKRWKRPDHEFHTHLDINMCAKRLSALGELQLVASRKLSMEPHQFSDVEWGFDARWSHNGREWVNAKINVMKRPDLSCYGLIILYPCKNPNSFWTYVFVIYEVICAGLLRIAQASRDLEWIVFFLVLVMLPFAYDIGRSAYEKRRFYQVINTALEV